MVLMVLLEWLPLAIVTSMMVTVWTGGWPLHGPFLSTFLGIV